MTKGADRNGLLSGFNRTRPSDRQPNRPLRRTSCACWVGNAQQSRPATFLYWRG